MKKTSEDYLDTLKEISKAITSDLYLENIKNYIRASCGLCHIRPV
ncbi:hypothetical protein OMAG_002339, partial [Candidatus Omnitrophus magneticus]